ncbi:hypothetical protein [Mesorhizobium retamae]|uniref:Uncharacterized protein n=1 Tax=Mesorhizobium retamae TaxID=2912854 RepID=A0ABS9QKM0_9HYPH|nr:hypothetical protein [Mesorhizobium sp. IRAMC:0171]MCG7508008.1 hypothetical protein [Mesorhizobium sp. IRAMC:0171]
MASNRTAIRIKKPARRIGTPGIISDWVAGRSQVDEQGREIKLSSEPSSQGFLCRRLSRTYLDSRLAWWDSAGSNGGAQKNGLFLDVFSSSEGRNHRDDRPTARHADHKWALCTILRLKRDGQGKHHVVLAGIASGNYHYFPMELTEFSDFASAVAGLEASIAEACPPAAGELRT